MLLADSLRKMNPSKFEEFVAEILIKEGFENVRLSGGPGDLGADIIAQKDGKKYIVQVKRWTSNIGESEIRKFRQSIEDYDADYGIFVTTSRFTPSAMRAAGRKVILWDISRLIELATKHRLFDFVPTKQHSKNTIKVQERKSVEPRKFEFSSLVFVPKDYYEVQKQIEKKVGSKIQIKEFVIFLSQAYAIKWKVNYIGYDSAGRKRKLVDQQFSIVAKNKMFPENNITSSASKTIFATKYEIDHSFTLEDALYSLANIIKKNYGSKPKILKKQRIYLAEYAKIEFYVGKTTGQCTYDYQKDKIYDLQINELPIKVLEEAIKEKLGEGKITIFKNHKFSFESDEKQISGEVNPYNAEIKIQNSFYKDVYFERKIKGKIKYSKQDYIGLEKDNLFEIYSINRSTGQFMKMASFPPELEIIERAKKKLHSLYGLKFDHIKSDVVDGKYVMNFKSFGIKVAVQNNEIINVEFDNDYVQYYVKQKFSSAQIVSIENNIVEIEDEKWHIKIEISSDGLSHRQLVKYIVKNVAASIALQKIPGKVKSIEKTDFGWTVVIDDSHWDYIITMDNYGNNVNIEEKLLNDNGAKEIVMKEVGWLKNIKIKLKKKSAIVIGDTDDGTWYTKINRRTGEIKSKDFVSNKGFMAKMKRAKLAIKYT